MFPWLSESRGMMGRRLKALVLIILFNEEGCRTVGTSVPRCFQHLQGRDAALRVAFLHDLPNCRFHNLACRLQSDDAQNRNLGDCQTKSITWSACAVLSSSPRLRRATVSCISSNLA